MQDARVRQARHRAEGFPAVCHPVPSPEWRPHHGDVGLPRIPRQAGQSPPPISKSATNRTAEPKRTATPGTHMLLVEADDINRISTERFKWNNLRARSVTLGDNPGRLSLETDSTPGSVAFDAAAVKDWAVFGCWNGQGKTERKQNINRIGNPTACGSGYVGIQPYCGTELCRTEENDTYRTRTGL